MSSPWANGPKEILKHGLGLLRKDSDSNRRLAIICIDNSVELMIKTFLGLPKRINKLDISRKEYGDFSESFPRLLDALEKFAPDRIKGLDLGDIEWYHRIRNELYHQGNGLTVEKYNVEIYSELAILLFENLFGERLIVEVNHKELLSDFLAEWVRLEAGLYDAAQEHSLVGRPRKSVLDSLKFLEGAGIVSRIEFEEIKALRDVRNGIIHGAENYHFVLTTEIVERTRHYAGRFGDHDGL